MLRVKLFDQSGGTLFIRVKLTSPQMSILRVFILFLRVKFHSQSNTQLQSVVGLRETFPRQQYQSSSGRLLRSRQTGQDGPCQNEPTSVPGPSSSGPFAANGSGGNHRCQECSGQSSGVILFVSLTVVEIANTPFRGDQCNLTGAVF